MANTQKTRFSFSLQDELGTKATVALYALLDPATTVAEAENTAGVLQTALEAVSGAKVIARGVHFEDMVTADATTAGSRVEQTAVLDYETLLSEGGAATGREYGIATPGWLDSLVGGGGAPVIGAGAGATWLADLTGNVPGTATGIMTSNDFQPLGAATDAFLSFRKRRKQLSRSSEELAP